MLYTIPDYYFEFQCTADACEDTCCAGWQIVIDDKALNRYRKEAGPYRKKLHKSIRWKQKVFRQDKEKRCAFLTEENLCEMYQKLGEKSLCRTCKMYPRHVEEFEGVREISLSLSCPEVAKMLVERKSPVTFRSVEKEGEEEFEDFEPFLYSQLLDARACLTEILQNRKLPMANRIVMSLGLAYDMEERVNKGQLFACGDVFESYRKQIWFSAAGRKADRFCSDMKKRYLFSKKMFRNLRKLERLKEDWEQQLTESENLLFSGGEAGYGRIQNAFQNWISEQGHTSGETENEAAKTDVSGKTENGNAKTDVSKERENEAAKTDVSGKTENGNAKTDVSNETEETWNWEIFCEQLMVYFIFTYFCGAVYDGRIFVNMQMAAASVSILWDLLAACWLKNEKTLDKEDVKEVVYRYSRELEHSDKNLKRFWRFLEEQKEL